MAEPYQSLYRRYRPQRFSEVRGQDHVTRALRNSVRNGTVHHAYLFSGPRGTGKTSSARILAKALNCTAPEDGEPCGTCESCVAVTSGSSLDVHELDAASNNGVDAMRDLVSRAALGTPGRWKVYIIDEVHMLSAAASNALLKTLEEPPGHVVFVLATTDPQKVLDTIKSRTQHFEFRLLGSDVLGGLLSDVSHDAGLALPQEALNLALRRGHGSARDALSFLDQVAASGVVDDESEAIDDLIEGLVEGDPGAVLRAVAQASAAGRDPQRLANDLIAQLRNGFLATMAPELVALPDEARDQAAQQAGRLGTPALVRIMERVGTALVDMREALDPRISLEVTLVSLTRRDGDSPRQRPSEPSAPDEAPSAATGTNAPAARAQVRSAATPSPAPARPSSPLGESVRSGPAAGARQALGAVRNRGRTAPAEGATAPAAASSTPTRAPARSRPDAGAEPFPEDPAAGTPPTQAAPATAKAAPATANAAPAKPGAGGTMPGRDEIVQAWGDTILAGLPGRPRARYGTGRFGPVEGDSVDFLVPNEAHRRFCEECKADVESALASHFGHPVGLRLLVDHEAAESPAVGRDHEPEEEIDLTALTDAPPVEAVSPEERLLRAFPGSEEVR